MTIRSRLILVACLALASCPKRVTVDDRETSAAQVEASRDLERLRAEASRLAPAVAAPRFEALAARAGDVPASADALLDAARLWRQARRPERARADLEELLARSPLSPRASEAKLQLAMVQMEAGQPRDALATIAPVYDELPPVERPAAAAAAAAAAEAAQMWQQAAWWRAEAARLSQGAARAGELAKAAEHLEKLGRAEASKLKEDLPPDSPLLPAVTMRLARLALQENDAGAAERSAREVLERWPESPLAQQARALADHISRRAPVSPRTIGIAVPLSGRFKAWGDAVMKGAALALGDGGAFRLAARDTEGDVEGAGRALEDLVWSDGAIAALGGVTNAEGPRAASAAQEGGLPFVSLAKVDGVTQAGPFVFRNMLTAEAQAKALADLAMASRGMRRFALIWPQITYGDELATAFWEQVEAGGGEVRAAETYEHDRTTFAPLVKSMVGKLWLEERRDYQAQARDVVRDVKDPYRRRKALERLRDQLPPIVDFDAIFIPDFAKNVALVAPAIAVEDIVTDTCDPAAVERIRRITGRPDLRPVQLLGANGWDDPQLVEKAGRYVNCAIFVDGFFAASQRPATKAFVAAFQAKYGYLPSILEASAFDAASMIRAVVERGARTREEVRAGLAALKGFPGATGDLAFDAQREIAKRLFYLTVDNGAVREMTPEELAAPGAGAGGR
jgi:ABC-type branched-subunit amino acid transport system substrate-binding protein